jgi:hypothetical protein
MERRLLPFTRKFRTFGEFANCAIIAAVPGDCTRLPAPNAAV